MAFEKEALVLNYAKCEIANQKELISGDYGGVYVTLMNSSTGYVLLFDGYRLELAIMGREIIDASFGVV